jgi:hypothetical protein
MAADAFDPYYKWLGIPPEEQPPTHYRLLGVVQFEADRDVIANAASRQAFHLRQLQAGPHAALAERLLKEVAAAKATLLDPEARAQYDQSLAPDFGLPADEIVPVATFRKKPAKSKGFDPTPLLVRVVPVVLIAAVLVFLLRGSDQKHAPIPDSVAATDPAPPPAGTGGDAEPSPSSATPSVDHPAVAADDDGPADRPDADPVADEPDAMDDADSGATKSARVEPPAAVTARRRDSAPAAGAAASEVVATAEMEPESAPEVDPTKEPVPSEDDQSKAQKLVRSAHKAEFAKAKTAEQKLALAKSLLSEARETDDATNERYALVMAAIDLAAAAGDFRLAVDGWSDLGEHFQVDALAGEWKMFEKSSKTKQVEALQAALQQFVEDSIDQDRYDLARGALEALLAQSKGEEAQQFETDLKNLDAMAARSAAAKSALKTLAANASDPQANLAAGEFLSFFKLDWSRGLLLLSRSGDATLKGLGRDELAQPDDPKKQVALADAWWNFGEGQSDGTIKKGARSRARFWYMLALPELTGDARDQAEKRATLEARARRQSVAEAKITPPILKSKFQGKASYDPQTNQLTIVYDFQEPSQLKDFEGDAQLSDGELNIALEKSMRHVVKFKTLKMTGMVTMKSKAGDVVRGSAGMQAQRDGASVKISSGGDAVSSSENGPADDDLVLPFELDANDKFVLFRLGDEVVGKPMAKSEPGQVQLCGGEAGAQFSQLVISGQPDPAWMTEFFDLPKTRAEKNPAGASSSGKTAAKAKPSVKFGHIAQVILWNEHNSNHNNSGTRTCSLTLSRNGKNVWQKKDLEIPWEPNQPTKLAVEVPQVIADSVRVAITAWHGESGGLSEVEVLDKAGKNLAAGAQVLASAEHRPGDPRSAATLIDGITDSANEKVGYWLPLNGQPGWADIRLLPQEAPSPPPPAPAKLAAASKEPPVRVRKKGTTPLPDPKIFVSCDDEFEMYVNAIPVLQGKENDVFSTSVPLAAGDVITVKATNRAGKLGFCCVIKFADGQVISTSDGWGAYVPANLAQWFMPNLMTNIGPVGKGDGDWPAPNVKKPSGVQAAQIWAPGWENTCYLFYVVGGTDQPRKKATK